MINKIAFLNLRRMAQKIRHCLIRLMWLSSRST